jgi:hypothetical protein
LAEALLDEFFLAGGFADVPAAWNRLNRKCGWSLGDHLFDPRVAGLRASLWILQSPNNRAMLR